MTDKKQLVKKFDKDTSNVIKGIAILMMLMHHHFLNTDRFAGYVISFAPFGQNVIIQISSFFKICVSIFAIISGYGLYLNYKNKKPDLSPTRWVISREIKTLSGFWIIYIFSIGICQFVLDGRASYIYFEKGVVRGIMYMLTDFLGIADLMNTPLFNGTWWYMSAAVVFILFVPVFKKFEDNLILVMAFLIVIPRLFEAGVTTLGKTSALSFLPAFLLGVIAARYDLVNRCLTKWNRSIFEKILKCVLEIIVLVMLFMLYGRIAHNAFVEVRWAFIPFAFILFFVEFIAYIPGIRQILKFLGRHSMNIFLIHTFVRWYYLRDFVYGMKHFALVIIMTLLISLAISMVLELIKKLIKYDAFIEKLRNRIEG